MTPTKSRDLPLCDLYSALQLEFVSYFLRSKTYRKDFAESYRQICDRKREKIERISSRNNLPSIFNDLNAKERYLAKFFNESGIPNFTYKDEAIKIKMERWDKHYYFQKGCSVSFQDGDVTLVGQVVHNDKNNSVVSILDESNNPHERHYNNVCRIFSEEFFDFH
jgi:hypothetical protein